MPENRNHKLAISKGKSKPIVETKQWTDRSICFSVQIMSNMKKCVSQQKCKHLASTLIAQLEDLSLDKNERLPVAKGMHISELVPTPTRNPSLAASRVEPLIASLSRTADMLPESHDLNGAAAFIPPPAPAPVPRPAFDPAELAPLPAGGGDPFHDDWPHW
jgi:hypothetical protein